MAKGNNILLVTIDSLRADAIYESDYDTPTYNTLAESGTVYERAFSQGPFTTFSMPSLFTSKYPSGLQYVEFSDKTVGVYINDEPTIPEVLRKQGYQTAGFHSNPLLSNLFGFDKGFDEFDARLPLSGLDRFSGRAKILTDKLLRVFRKHAYLPAEKLNQRAVEWLDGRDDDRPFFLWLHYMDVHGPYQAKSGNAYLNKYQGEHLWRKALKRPDEVTESEHEQLKKLYRIEVEYTDQCLGDLFNALRARSLFEETLTVVTADHGEQFYEHGRYSHPHQLYDELTHVPLILRDPGRRSTPCDRVTELVDVAPTLVEHAGGDVPASFSGRSLFADTSYAANKTDMPTPTDDETLPEFRSEPAAFSEADLTPAYNGSVRTNRWRYIRNETTDEELLFDHERNSDEQRDVLSDHPAVVDCLRDRLTAHTDAEGRSVGPDRDVTRRDIEDGEVQDRLEDLGYLG
ncbi:sulfatase [Natrinema amylolyticum]|uniref:sulfatase n=1 Tax=Natrinema amylolyticum TaxID=2878679 RepID=UPI001CFB0B8E|nr:sulfatase [Natrinema amylolyticum]